MLRLVHGRRAGVPAVLAAAVLLACAKAPEPPPPGAGEDAPHLLEDLGGFAYPITTASPLAQRYFDQGLAFVYGFNHDAAVRSFWITMSFESGSLSCELTEVPEADAAAVFPDGLVAIDLDEQFESGLQTLTTAFSRA